MYRERKSEKPKRVGLVLSMGSEWCEYCAPCRPRFQRNADGSFQMLWYLLKRHSPEYQSNEWLKGGEIDSPTEFRYMLSKQRMAPLSKRRERIDSVCKRGRQTSSCECRREGGPRIRVSHRERNEKPEEESNEKKETAKGSKEIPPGSQLDKRGARRNIRHGRAE